MGHRKVSTGLKNSSYSVPRRWSDIVILCLCENISEDMQANVRVYDLVFQKCLLNIFPHTNEIARCDEAGDAEIFILE